MLNGQPYRRTLERDGKPLSPEERRTEQKKLDKETRQLGSFTLAEKQRRLAEAENGAARIRVLAEIPHCSTSGSRATLSSMDDQSGWSPARRGRRQGQERRRQNAAETARPNVDRQSHLPMDSSGSRDHRYYLLGPIPSASQFRPKMIFEQTAVNSELWLPKRLLLSGSGRVGLIKRLFKDEEIEWSNYKKFRWTRRL